MVGKLFVRRRDARVEVRVSDEGRQLLRDIFVRVVAAERDPDHEWHAPLNGPITPSSDDDDPLATLKRQSDIASNAELSFMSVNEQFLNDGEAWAWLATLQVALRSTALAHGVLSDERLATCEGSVLDEIHTLQRLLYDLANCF